MEEVIDNKNIFIYFLVDLYIIHKSMLIFYIKYISFFQNLIIACCFMHFLYIFDVFFSFH